MNIEFIRENEDLIRTQVIRLHNLITYEGIAEYAGFDEKRGRYIISRWVRKQRKIDDEKLMKIYELITRMEG